MSQLEDQVTRELTELNFPFERQYRFYPDRQWKADFYINIPEFGHPILIEIEGGEFSGGRHGTGMGLTNDAIKYNTAALLGFTVYRFTGTMVKRGDVKRFLEENYLNLQNPPFIPETLKPKKKTPEPKLQIKFKKHKKQWKWDVFLEGMHIGFIDGYRSGVFKWGVGWVGKRKATGTSPTLMFAKKTIKEALARWKDKD